MVPEDLTESPSEPPRPANDPAATRRAFDGLLTNGYQPFLLPWKAKSPPPLDLTGWNGWPPDSPEYAAYVAEARHSLELEARNIGVRLPRDVFGIDFDAYKPAAKKVMQQLVERYGDTPPTWVSSSRGAPSGIYLFRVPPELIARGQVRTGWRGAAECIHWGHRYAVTAPSYNQSAGAQYRVWHSGTGELRDWMPAISELPLLPEPWQKALRPDAWSPNVPTVRDTNGHKLSVEARHDKWLRRSMAKIRDGEDLTAAKAEFIAEVTRPPDARTLPQAEAEWNRMVENAADVLTRDTQTHTPRVSTS